MTIFVKLRFTGFSRFGGKLSIIKRFTLHSFCLLFQLDINIDHFKLTKHTFYSTFQIFNLFRAIMR